MKQLAFLVLSSTPSLENIAHIAKPLILTDSANFTSTSNENTDVMCSLLIFS
jgi:hypothetical protein